MPLSYPPVSGYNFKKDGIFHTDGNSPWWRIDDNLPKNPDGSYASFTVEFYIWLERDSGYVEVLNSTPESDDTSFGFRVFFRLEYNDQIRAVLDSTYSSLGSIEFNSWMHIAVTYDGNEMRTYKNGTYLGGHTVTSTNAPGSTYFHGHQSGLRNDAPKIEVANLRFWDHPRTQVQIMEDSVSDRSANEPGLIAAYRLDSGLFNEAADVGTGNALLINNEYSELPNLLTNRDVLRSNNLVKGYVLVGGNGGDGSSSEDGPGVIQGVVTVDGLPSSQRVIALNRETGKKASEAMSKGDGTYTLKGLKIGTTYVVVAIDSNMEYNGVIADNVTPVLL